MANIANASRGPTPETVWTRSKTARSSSSAKPYSVSDSSRTTSLVDNVASAPGRRAAAVPAVVCNNRPTPPTSITAQSRPADNTTPRTEAIIVALCSAGGLPDDEHAAYGQQV